MIRRPPRSTRTDTHSFPTRRSSDLLNVARLPVPPRPHIEKGPERGAGRRVPLAKQSRSEEHTSELQSLMRISYAVFCLKKKTINTTNIIYRIHNTINITHDDTTISSITT